MKHLALPNLEDVITGVKTSRIAAHVEDMVKYPDRAREQDLAMGRARRELDWEKMYSLAIDPEHARAVRASRAPEDIDACTMCGNYCALKIVNQSYNLAK